MENELEVLGDEKKYNFLNKFGPKKCPDKKIIRSSIPHLYSWQHFAPISWFEHIKKGSIEALECKTYWDIRFNKEPKLDKITESLEKIANSIGSTRAFNTLAELAHS